MINLTVSHHVDSPSAVVDSPNVEAPSPLQQDRFTAQFFTVRVEAKEGAESEQWSSSRPTLEVDSSDTEASSAFQRHPTRNSPFVHRFCQLVHRAVTGQVVMLPSWQIYS